MDDQIQDMIDKGLASIESREILNHIPLLLASTALVEYNHWYWLDYERANRN